PLAVPTFRHRDGDPVSVRRLRDLPRTCRDRRREPESHPLFTQQPAALTLTENAALSRALLQNSVAHLGASVPRYCSRSGSSAITSPPSAGSCRCALWRRPRRPSGGAALVGLDADAGLLGRRLVGPLVGRRTLPFSLRNCQPIDCTKAKSDTVSPLNVVYN